jgi:excisionase family DNA binding protein
MNGRPDSDKEASRSTPEDLVADGLRTVKFAGEFLSASRTTVYKMMNDGDLPFVKIGRARRIPHRALVEAAARGLVALWTAKRAREREAR